MANTIDKVLEVANNEVGYLEKRSNAQLDSKTGNAGSNNYTKYWRDLKAGGLQTQPWCNAFVDWCFMKAYGEKEGKKLLHQEGGWEYYTPSSAALFKNHGQWHSSPQVGDIIYFRNSSRICHVGIVRAVDSGTVYTIEGNTSNGTAVVANGGGVCKKSYSRSNFRIAGYGRPNYSGKGNISSSGGNKDIKTGQEWSVKFTGSSIACDGDRGPITRKQSVKVLQTALNKQYNAKLVVDGEIGPKTKAALSSHSVKKGDKSYMVLGAKIMLKMLGKPGMKYNQTYGSGCVKAAGKDKIVANDFLNYTK